MHLNKIIESAEKQYKQILEEYFISVYDERSLPSHGIDHHRRVWEHSKELLFLFPIKNKKQFTSLTSELLIASYLHDIGMVIDHGIKHGIYSKDLCARFLALNNLSIKDNHGLLQAIENHDNKEYITNSVGNNLLTFLSLSDDLDAFGFTGIYRYAEIYLSRNTSYLDLGISVLDNSEKRFNNFARVAGKSKKFVEKHRLRYSTLRDFFSKYNEQLPGYQFGSLKPYSYCGVIELFGMMIKNKIDLNELIEYSGKFQDDNVIQWFFSGLKSEIES